MQRNAPQPTVRNCSICDSAFGREGHSGRPRPIPPKSNILECVVVSPILQIAHSHEPCSPRRINQVVEGYLPAITTPNHLRPASALWPISIKGEAADLCPFKGLHSLALCIL